MKLRVTSRDQKGEKMRPTTTNNNNSGLFSVCIPSLKTSVYTSVYVDTAKKRNQSSLEPGMVVHACNTAHEREKRGEVEKREFKAILGFIVSLRPV